MIKMKKTIYILALLSLLFGACKNNKKLDDAKEEQSNEITVDSVKTATDSVVKSTATTAIIDGYLKLKNALVNDDESQAASAGKIILTAFAAFDKSTLTKNQLKLFNENIEDAQEQVEHIIKSPIDHQREHFMYLTEDMNDLIAQLGTEKTLYQDFCPMANDGKGAIWLSEIKEINNPYMGSKMMHCGSIKKTIN